MRSLLTCLLILAVSSAAAQDDNRIYQGAEERAAKVFPDARSPGSPLNKGIAEVKAELEHNKDPLVHSAGMGIIAAVRAAAKLQKERPEAAPNPKDVAARCLGMVEKEYGDLNDPSSAFAKAFWEHVPEVRANLPEFNITGAWPLAAGAMAELQLSSRPTASSRASVTFDDHQRWLLVGGGTEWPPKDSTTVRNPITVTQTGPDTWLCSDGTTITRIGSTQYEVK